MPNRLISLALALACAAPVLSAQQRSAGPDDATIVAIYDAANTADIETGQLALERGSTEAIRNFGRMLVNDHSSVRKLGRDLATRLGVTPTPPSDNGAARAHASAMTRLRGLNGAAFDRAFLEHEIAFHASVVEAVTSTLLPAIDNAELKALVEQVVPAFVGHQKAAEVMLAKL